MLEKTKIRNQFGAWKSREQEWLAEHAEGHKNLKQIATKYGKAPDTMLKLLPPPDKVCPYGVHTRLWHENTIRNVLGENNT